jgi:hypothetical protein
MHIFVAHAPFVVLSLHIGHAAIDASIGLEDVDQSGESA